MDEPIEAISGLSFHNYPVPFSSPSLQRCPEWQENEFGKLRSRAGTQPQTISGYHGMISEDRRLARTVTMIAMITFCDIVGNHIGKLSRESYNSIEERFPAI